ncbi:Crp/Fnr family transcriptional regulator [Aquimarina sp. U1-2]|uniref:Crp/Fnr family transcriptional regulator n=1 Tax=Aquimarina sp. U1-2 TaxID=2823141 RepID=UPI00353003AB
MTKSVITSHIFKEEQLSLEEINFIQSKFESISVDKGDIVLRMHDRVTHQFYVIDGCLRTFFIDVAGKEHTLQFAVKDWWISDYTAYFEQKEALLTIECIQPAKLYKIYKEDIEEIYQTIPKIETHFRKKLEKSFSSFQNRILGNLSKPAKERYIDFMRAYPDINAKIKNYHIASYLGITTESLSRIRKEIAS